MKPTIRTSIERSVQGPRSGVYGFVAGLSIQETHIKPPLVSQPRPAIIGSMTPPPAGSWIRLHPAEASRPSDRWHLFTGDMIWRPAWAEPSLEGACGYTTGVLTGSSTLHVIDAEPDEPCLLCVARAPLRPLP
jgi:hypothetical protein